MTGTIPQEIGRLWNLKILSLCFDNLHGSIPEPVFNISSLETINLVSNQLSGELPLNFGNKLPNVQYIHLEKNSLTGILPDSISNATQLLILDLNHNRFAGTFPKSLGNLKHLELLSMHENNFTSTDNELSFLTSLTNCRNLSSISLDGNSLNGYLPASIGNFSDSLTQFYANYCGIKGSIPNEIGNVSSLIILALEGNELTDRSLVSIKGLSKLQQLALGDNRIGGSMLSYLCQLHNLGGLGIETNYLSGPLPACLGNITSLRYLYLHSNNFTSSLPRELGNLRDVLEFNISRNSLSGHIPVELGNLKAAVLIDLSHNQLFGDIPISLGELQSLVDLSLSNNRLHGSIPDTFKHLLSIEYLDLSNNKLSGMIPKSLEALNYLKYFNVSSNSLRGEIPNGGPFKRFSAQDFLQNEALCGASQFQVPKCPTTSGHGSSNKKRVLLAVCISVVIAGIILTFAFTFVLIRRRRKARLVLQPDLPTVIGPTRFSYYEIQHATNGFSKENLLGMGSFGSVYKALLSNGMLVAIKVFNLQHEGGFRSFDVECEVLRNLRHRNINKVIGSCSNLDFKALVLEYMPNGTLEKWLYSHNHFLDIFQRIDLMMDVASALDYLHNGYSTPVVHCDLKPSNVLLDEYMVARVSDFGMSKLLGDEESITKTMTLATIGYIAPGDPQTLLSIVI